LDAILDFKEKPSKNSERDIRNSQNPVFFFPCNPAIGCPVICFEHVGLNNTLYISATCFACQPQGFVLHIQIQYLINRINTL